MAKYEITQNQMKNLEAFLARVDLKGNEVLAFSDVLNTLQNPVQEEKEEKVNK